MHWVKSAGWPVAGLLAALILAAHLDGPVDRADLPQGKRSYWLAQMRGHLVRVDRNTPAGATLFFGSSSVQGLNAAMIRPCSANFGIGHETARELGDRMPAYRSIAEARAVVVATGLNDVLRGSDSDLAASYRSILAAVPAGTPVVMSSLQRLAPDSMAGQRHARRVDRANVAARQACATNGDCVFVDLAGQMDGERSWWEADGIHLSAAGYELWAELLDDALGRAGVSRMQCDAPQAARP
jgi:hypothetical protein